MDRKPNGHGYVAKDMNGDGVELREISCDVKYLNQNSDERSNGEFRKKERSKQVKVPLLERPLKQNGLSLYGMRKQLLVRITSVTDEGLVALQPFFPNGVKGDLGVFELDDLQLYFDSPVLKKVLTTWPWDKTCFALTVVTNAVQDHLSTSSNAVRLYQELPHGRVYINRQIQLRIHQELKMAFQSYLNQPRLVSILKASTNGDLWLRIFKDYHLRILNYVNQSNLPPPETLDELMERNMTDLFVVRSAPGNYQRIRIEKIFYIKKKLKVEYVDLGDFDEVIWDENVYSCFKIDPNFAQFPPLAVKGHLAGVASMNVEELMSTTGDTDMVAVRDKAEEFDFEEVTPDVKVYCDSSQKSLLNKLLVENHHAVPEIPPEQWSLYTRENYLKKP